MPELRSLARHLVKRKLKTVSRLSVGQVSYLSNSLNKLELLSTIVLLLIHSPVYRLKVTQLAEMLSDPVIRDLLVNYLDIPETSLLRLEEQLSRVLRK